MKRRTRGKKHAGFTLVEILVCLAIFGLLMSIASVAFAGVLQKSRYRLEEANRRRNQDGWDVDPYYQRARRGLRPPPPGGKKQAHIGVGSGYSGDGGYGNYTYQNNPTLDGLRETFPKNFGNNQETRDYYKKAGLDFKAIHFMRVAAAFRSLGLLDVALKNALLAAELRPKDEHIHATIGAILRDKGELENSLKAYQKAMKCDDESPEVHIGLGQTLIAMGNVGEGLDHMLKAHKLHPENPEYLARIGQVYFDHGDASQARDFIKRAIKQEPEVVALVSVEALEKLKIKMPKGI